MLQNDHDDYATFTISSDEIIIVNNGQFKLFLTFENDKKDAISYFESNSSHFQYAKKEENSVFDFLRILRLSMLCFC